MELLGSDDLAVRVGAIRALERLSKDSRTDDRAIYGLLTAYIRHHSPYRPGHPPVTEPTGPATGTGDATTDARQQERADRMDCERRFPGLASLQKCAFDVHLALQVLSQRPTTLSDGRSFVPSLVDTDLRKAHLEKAKLTGADLSSVDLTGAKLAGATYDAKTRFPDGFDPDTHGLLPVPEPADRPK